VNVGNRNTVSLKRRLARFAQVGVLVLLIALTFYPFAFLLINSFKNIPQFYLHPWWFVFPFHTENYADAWQVIYRYIGSSIVVCLLTAGCMLLLSSVAAFAFARFRFPGRDLLFYAILSLLMIPGVLMLVPTFILVRDLGLLNSHWVLLLPFISGSQVMAIFLLRGFFAEIPEDLFEAARIDGASTFQQLIHVAIPLAKPIIGTLAILNILATWNNFIWPQVTVTDQKLAVVTNGILQFSSQYGTNYGPMFAGYIISSVPLLILILFTMQAFLKGVTSGAFKM